VEVPAGVADVVAGTAKVVGAAVDATVAGVVIVVVVDGRRAASGEPPLPDPQATSVPSITIASTTRMTPR
jgi:hypothetical protein